VTVGRVALFVGCLLAFAACSPAGALSLSEGNNTRSYTVKVGGRVTVTLHNTYWATPTSSEPGVLAPQGDVTTISPGLGEGGCPSIPGTGCGSVTRVFVAKKAGGATITSSRRVCGEALACSPPQRFTVVVTVDS